MVISIFIWVYFSFKLILTDKLNETNFSFQLQNSRDEKNPKKYFGSLISLANKNSEPKEEIYNLIIYILETARDSPAFAGNIIDLIRDSGIIIELLNNIFIQNNISFLYNLTEDAFRKDSGFYPDLKQVLINHSDFVNYTLILVKNLKDGKNITGDEILEYIYNITNIDGVDKLLVIYSIQLIMVRFFN